MDDTTPTPTSTPTSTPTPTPTPVDNPILNPPPPLSPAPDPPGPPPRSYGWRPDRPDPRDRHYTVSVAARRVPLPPSADLRPGLASVPIYDQGDLGSCTANAIAAAIDYERIRQSLPPLFPSRLFIYYNERVIEGSVGVDAGAEIRDGIKSVAATGVCPESEWPYDIGQFAVAPPSPCYSDAVSHRALQYSRVTQSAYYPKHCIGILRRPVVFGFTVYSEFESAAVARTGIVPMPGPGSVVLGGHAVLAVGYDDARSAYLVRNSWGPGWGLAGHFWLPYMYLTRPDLASDFWTILVEA